MVVSEQKVNCHCDRLFTISNFMYAWETVKIVGACVGEFVKNEENSVLVC